INLLDAHVFADRDRTADSVVRVARGLWEQWGPRMQSILEHTVKTLHEANAHPDTDARDQHTILDGLRLLSDAKFRGQVLARVDDPYLLDWWARDFGGWHRDYRAEALAPVQTRLGYYASSRRARAILGQPASTVDVRRTILDGGVLLISTAQGQAGRDVAALVGASLLNLVDAVVREQGSLPPERRRGVLVVVDEMQTMPGVDYEGMLSELGKFGASFILASQSLSKLEDLSRGMRDPLLANVGCLAVFQVSGADARQLVWELGKERVTEDDVTSLEVHHCYVRATVGTRRMPAFSMQVRKPEEGDPETAVRIREASLDYTTAVEEVAYRDADAEERIAAYRRGLAGITDKTPEKPAAKQPHAGRTRKGKEADAGEPDKPAARAGSQEREE
ncbi:MAG: type IV secretory system conjugative DNA transfer family protein, partial [Chloroflexi bacterium]|nr:type IV secretory system conjugative DNA transfer family protein [Chloroflexota bacterium]